MIKAINLASNLEYKKGLNFGRNMEIRTIVVGPPVGRPKDNTLVRMWLRSVDGRTKLTGGC